MNNEIKKYQFKSGFNFEFEILDLSKRLKTSGAMMNVPHRAQFYHILWIEKGTGTHFVDFKPIPLKDNMLIFVAHNSVNQYDPKGSYQGKAIIFTKSFFCKNQSDVHFLNSSILFSDLYPTAYFNIIPCGNQLNILVNSIQTEFTRETDHAQYPILHNMLHIFLLQAEREMKTQGFKTLKPGLNLEMLLQFKEILEQEFQRKKSVKEYALLLNVSEKQLHKASTTLLDKTPKKLIDERIILEAKRLLVHSSAPVKEISYQLGFEEPTNFVKYFKKHENIPPLEFRSSNN